MSSVQYRIWCMKSIEPMLVIVIYHTIFLDLFSFQFLTGVAWELYLKQLPADESEKQMEITCHDDNKESEVAQSCQTLCSPMDCSLPGFSVHGIFQARLLEWVAISFSRGSSWPRNRTLVSWHCRQTLYRLSHQGSPNDDKAVIKQE